MHRLQHLPRGRCSMAQLLSPGPALNCHAILPRAGTRPRSPYLKHLLGVHKLVPCRLMSTRERRDRAIRQRRSGLSAWEPGETPRSELGDDALSQHGSFARISPGRGNPRGPSRLGTAPLTPDGACMVCLVHKVKVL